jgi:hypothetical protein
MTLGRPLVRVQFARGALTVPIRTIVGACLLRLDEIDSGVLMKVLGAAAGVLIALYFADQEFAQGQFTDAVRHVGAQMMHSFGI